MCPHTRKISLTTKTSSCSAYKTSCSVCDTTVTLERSGQGGKKNLKSASCFFGSVTSVKFLSVVWCSILCELWSRKGGNSFVTDGFYHNWKGTGGLHEMIPKTHTLSCSHPWSRRDGESLYILSVQLWCTREHPEGPEYKEPNFKLFGGYWLIWLNWAFGLDYQVLG